MSIDPTFSYQVPALTLALTQTVRVTLDALADMYDRKDGPWVDELRDAALNVAPPLAAEDVQQLDALFDALRGDLKPRSSLR